MKEEAGSIISKDTERLLTQKVKRRNKERKEIKTTAVNRRRNLGRRVGDERGKRRQERRRRGLERDCTLKKAKDQIVSAVGSSPGKI